MSFDTVNHILWPHDMPNTERQRCASCHEIISDAEMDDPIVIDGDYYCDYCASDLMAFRVPPFTPLAHKTKRLVNSERFDAVEFAHSYFGYNPESK